MATTLYCRDSTNSGIGSFRDLSTSRGGGSTTGVVNSTAGGTNIQWTKTAGGSVLEWISGKVASAFTLSGTVSVRLRALESSMNNNCGGRCRIYRRTTGGSESEIGLGDDGAEFGTSEGNLDWTISPTSTDFAEDERIIVRFFITNVGTMAAGTCTMSYDGPTASAAGDTFITINENVAFKPDHFSQTSFRWYEDGTEAGATAIAAQDTNISRNPSASPAATFKLATLRVRIQSTAVGGASNDDWPLYKSRNGGAYVRMGASVTGWWIFGNGSLTDNGATTNRLGSGSGSFVAGKICAGNRSPENAVDDYQLTAGNYTELVYELESTQDQRVNGDTWDFRVYYDAASSGSSYAPLGSYTQTPRLTVQHPQYDQRAFRFFNDDGSQTTSTAIAAQNTNPSYATLGSNIFHLRMQWQETAGFECVNNWQWAPYYRVNGGSWAQITDVSNYIRIVASANISDGETLTTSRLTGGTGSMVESYARDNGASNFSTAAITANNYKEMLHAMQLQTADWADGDILEICQAWGNAVPSDSPNAVTQTVMPTIERASATKVGEADFDGVGNLSAFGRVGMRAQARFDGAGNVSALARARLVAYADFDGAGSLSALARQQMAAYARFAGAGSLSVDAYIPVTGEEQIGEAEFDGVGSLSAHVRARLVAYADFDGAGNLSAFVQTVKFGEARFAGVGNLSVNMLALLRAEARFNGTGSLSALTQSQLAAYATFAGAGSMSIDAIVRGQIIAEARFDGTGNMSALANVVKFAEVNFAGAGSLSVYGRLRAVVEARFAGAGSFSVEARNTKTAEARFEGTGSLSAAALQWMTAQARFGGVGSMSVLVLQRMVAQALFAGAGSMSAEAIVRGQHIGEADFDGTGSFSALVTGRLVAYADFDGVGSLSANVVQRQIIEARFTGAGSLAVDARNTKTAEARFAGAGSFRSDVRLGVAGYASFQGAGNFSVYAGQIMAVQARFQGAGSLSGLVLNTKPAEAMFAGSGSLSVYVRNQMVIEARFNGVSDLSVMGLVAGQVNAWPGEIRFEGAGNMSARVVQRQVIQARFAGAGSMSALGQVRTIAQARFNGVGSFSIDVGKLAKVIEARFAGAGSFSVLVQRALAVSARFDGAGNMSARVVARYGASVQFDGAGNLQITAVQRHVLGAGAGAIFAGAGSLEASATGGLSPANEASAEFAGTGRMFIQVLVVSPEVSSQAPRVWDDYGFLRPTFKGKRYRYQGR